MAAINPSHSYSENRIAASLALGAVLGIVPLLGLHTLFFLLLPVVFRLSPRGFVLGWVITVPVGFLLDPFFDVIGFGLLTSFALRPFWVTISNLPLVPLTGFSNTVDLGSWVVWIVAVAPLFLLTRWALARYQGVVRVLFALPWIERILMTRFAMRLFADGPGRHGWLRKRVAMPLGVMLAGTVAAWWVFADAAARIGFERLGTAMVGATVDVARANLDLSDGLLSLEGLQVTDPTQPENNLLQAGMIAGALSAASLLRARLEIDSLVLRDVRFNVPRETPGTVDSRRRGSFFRDEMARWRASVRVPAVPAPDLGPIAELSFLDADSLMTVVEARRIMAVVAADQANYETRLATLQPSPQIAAARALVDQLEGASPARLGIAGTARKAAEVRNVIARLGASASSLSELGDDVAASLAMVRTRTLALDSLRVLDYDNALGSLNLPSLNPGVITSSLLEEPLMDRVENLLHWASVIDSYLPDGDEPGFFAGLHRFRRNGRVVNFPGENRPAFSLDRAIGSVTIGEMSGFVAELFDVSTDPRLTGRPAVFRMNGENGNTRVRVEAVVDRVSGIPADEVRAQMDNLPLAPLAISALGATLIPGEGDMRIALSRTADSISGVLLWTTTNASWVPNDSSTSSGPLALVWGVVSQLKEVDFQINVAGTITAPSLAISSNIGNRVAAALRERIGEEAIRNRALVRERIDGLVETSVGQANASVSEFQESIGTRVDEYRNQLGEAGAALQRRLRQLRPRIPGIGG